MSYAAGRRSMATLTIDYLMMQLAMLDIDDDERACEALTAVIRWLEPYAASPPAKTGDCPYESHHYTCECGGAGGDR